MANLITTKPDTFSLNTNVIGVVVGAEGAVDNVLAGLEVFSGIATEASQLALETWILMFIRVPELYKLDRDENKIFLNHVWVKGVEIHQYHVW